LLREGIETQEYPVLAFLMDDNIKGLFEFARESGYKEPVEGYSSKCHLCMDIRRHLSFRGNFEELSPKEFYKRLEG